MPMENYSSKKILIVDDEPDVRLYLKSALEDYGFSVETAVDGFDALEKMEKFTPDLISLDLVMPKHSGIKFYRDIKKRKEWSKIPVLIVTGHAKDDLGKADFDTLIMQGPGVYLEKPVKPNNYVATICHMLGIESPVDIKEESEIEADKLRDELMKNLSTADSEALQKALDALKKS